MSVLVNEKTRVLVQGFTGREGTFHAQQMIEYGTNVVGGITPGKGGNETSGAPSIQYGGRRGEGHGGGCFGDFCAAALCCGRDSGSGGCGFAAGCMHHGRNSSAGHGARRGSGRQSQDATDWAELPRNYFPGKMQNRHYAGADSQTGNRGVVSRSGTLTYEAVHQLTQLGIGQSTCIGIGGDPIIGTTFLDSIKMFNDDPDTHAIMLIGEIGGNAEERASAWIKVNVKKPVVGFIAGQTAPPGRRMGHAGAIISGGQGTAKNKYAAMNAAGIRTVETPADLGSTVATALKA